MPAIIANLTVKDPGGFKHQFTSEVKLPEFPRVGERVFLRVGGRFRKFRAVKRWGIGQDEDFIEYDFRRCLFVNRGYSLWLGIEDDTQWKPFHRKGFRKIIEERKRRPALV